MKKFYQNNKEYYERNALKYEKASWYYFNAYKNNEVKRELGICLHKLKHLEEIEILEIGPGTGYLLQKINEIGKYNLNYTGIDHSVKMSEIVTQRHSKSFKNFNIINETVTNDNLLKLFSRESFDLIMGSSILTHLLDYDDVLKTLFSLVKKEGVIYFVREPVHREEIGKSSYASDKLEVLYRNVYSILMKEKVRRFLWPEKVRAEDVTSIAPHMYGDGISLKVVDSAVSSGEFSLLFMRKYNRRATALMSYIENKWLSSFRKDIFGNTLFSFAIQKLT